jgi:AraC-like DNA-binding protein
MEPLSEKVLFKEGSSLVAFRRQDEKYDFNWHIHPEFEIVFIVEGFGTRYVGNSVEDYRQGEVVFVSPGIPHAWQSAEESTQNNAYVVHFDKECFGCDWYRANELKEAAKLLQSQSSWLVQDVPQAIEHFEKLQKANGLQKAAAFLELLDFILKEDKQELGSMIIASSSAKIEKIEKVIDYLKNNFQELLTVDSVADSMSLSTYQLRTMFKKHTNKSVLQYLNELRVFEACRLMQYKEYTISYLSAQAGFNNLSYFNRIFLKVTGKTPREYRKVFCN